MECQIDVRLEVSYSLNSNSKTVDIPYFAILKISKLLVAVAGASSCCVVARDAVGHWLLQNWELLTHAYYVRLFVCLSKFDVFA